MTEEATVVARRDGRVGRILLNRPRALNALDLPMLHACAAALDTWRDDPHVDAVVIEGAGDRAFCAGGDIISAARDAQISGNRPVAETNSLPGGSTTLTSPSPPTPSRISP